MALSRSQQMARVKSTNTRPEQLLRTRLWARGLRYRKQRKVLGFRPDLTFVGARLVVFVDGCFWHGYPTHYVFPRSRRSTGRPSWSGTCGAIGSRPVGSWTKAGGSSGCSSTNDPRPGGLPRAGGRSGGGREPAVRDPADRARRPPARPRGPRGAAPGRSARRELDQRGRLRSRHHALPSRGGVGASRPARPRSRRLVRRPRGSPLRSVPPRSTARGRPLESPPPSAAAVPRRGPLGAGPQ